MTIYIQDTFIRNPFVIIHSQVLWLSSCSSMLTQYQSSQHHSDFSRKWNLISLLFISLDRKSKCEKSFLHDKKTSIILITIFIMEFNNHLELLDRFLNELTLYKFFIEKCNIILRNIEVFICLIIKSLYNDDNLLMFDFWRVSFRGFIIIILSSVSWIESKSCNKNR